MKLTVRAATFITFETQEAYLFFAYIAFTMIDLGWG